MKKIITLFLLSLLFLSSSAIAQMVYMEKELTNNNNVEQKLTKAPLNNVINPIVNPQSPNDLNIYLWNGADVSGGTGGTDCNAAANWKVGGVVATIPPGPTDSCVMNLNGAVQQIYWTSTITIGALTVNFNNSLLTFMVVNVGVTLTINGDVNLVNTGGGNAYLGLTPGATPSNVVIGGNAYIGVAGSGTYRVAIACSSQTAGIPTVTYKGNVTFGTYAKGNFATNMTFDGTGTQNINSSISASTGPMAGVITVGNINSPTVVLQTNVNSMFQDSAQFYVKNNAIFDVGSTAFTALTGTTPILNLLNNGTFRLASTWPAAFTGTPVMAATSTVEYYGTTQTVKAIAYGNLKINAAGTKTLGGTTSCNSSLILQAGTLALGNYDLTLGLTSTVSGTPGATNMVVADNAVGTGKMNKIFPTGSSSAFTFPIGDNAGNYTPAQFTFTSNSTQRTLGVWVKGTSDLHGGTPADYINRYWNVSNSSTADAFTTTAVFTFVPSDIVGTITNCTPTIWIGSWLKPLGTVASPTISITSFTETASLGNYEFTCFTGTPTGSSITTTELPTKYELYQNYPNPFNPTSSIKYDVPEKSNVKIMIFDVAGKEVSTLVNKSLAAGRYETQFDGAKLSSGIYFCRIDAGKFSKIIKMMMVK